MKIYSREELNSYPYSLTYSDLGLIPELISDFTSRTLADTSIDFLGLKLALPILSAPMSTVTGVSMCLELKKLGCLGVLNRFDDDLEIIENFDEIQAISIGLNTTMLSNLHLEKIICLDTANAHNSQIIAKCADLKSRFPEIKLIVGNIAFATPEFMELLSKVGVKAIRCGVGSGAGCITSIKTGIGIGQISTILNIRKAIDLSGVDIKLIADGGIKSSGDIVRALTLGAECVMIGSVLAGTDEAPGKIIKFNGFKYKIYAGSASEFQKGNNSFIEGEQGLIKYKGNVENVIRDLSDGIKSGMSYLNCKTIEELKQVDNKFIILTQNSQQERNSYV